MIARLNLGGSDFRDSPSVLTIARVVAAGLSLISAPLIARAIGPEGRGETAAALAFLIIVPVVIEVGMPMEVRRLAAVSGKDAVLRSARRIIATMTIASLALGLAGYATVFSSFDSFARIVSACGVAFSAIPASWDLDVSVLLANQRFAAVGLLQVVQPAIYVLLLVVFWGLGIASVATVLIAYTLGNIANFIVGLVLTRVPARGETIDYRQLLRKSLDLYGGSVAQIASSRLDQVLALPLIGAQQAGYYSVAVTIGSVPMVLLHSLDGSYFRAIARAEGAERVQLQTAAVRSAIAIALMLCPLLALTAWPLVPVVFGSEFDAARTVTLFAVAAGGIKFVAFMASSSIAAGGRGRLMTSAQATGLVVGILGLAVLGQVAGALGAAIASALGCTLTVLILSSSLGTRPRDFLPKPADFADSIKRLWQHELG
jgi:O-antigen/teichoic acid export membrane protein